jgi:nucleotide-binding universal stress UspA family protein
MAKGYERVLIPTDFSPWAAASVERCPEIPGVKEVVLLHITPPRVQGNTGPATGGAKGNNDDLKTQKIRTQLEQDGQFLTGQGLSVSVIVEPSDGPAIARTILNVADRCGAHLILIGARGAGLLRETLLGSVSHDVLRNAKRDILIMHPRSRNSVPGGNATACPLLFSAILCPVDLSRVSEETIRHVAELDRHSRFILFHAIPRAESVAELNLMRARATERLQALQKDIGGSGGSSEILVRMGDPVLLSVTEAERSNASLILLSRYGRFDYMKNIPIGGTAETIALRSSRPVLIRNQKIDLAITVRELSADEFALAEKVWEKYHSQKADAGTDRIYALFVEGVIAGVARCRRHTDGYEVDGVFVDPEFRDRGYARRLMQELLREQGHLPLYMHAVLGLVSFYKSFGFSPIPETELPDTIRERFSFAQGNMEGSDVCPMKREGRGMGS